MMRNWMMDLIMDYVRKNGPELGLRIGREVILPYLKEQAAKTQNRLDNYAVAQLERILKDPEFIAILEGVV